MSYLPLLTEDEARYICSVIPHEIVTDYFQRHPKELAKIRPGFRAKALTKNDVSRLLFSFRTRDFISSFIERRIGEWLNQIQKYYNERVVEGDDSELALLHTLPFSFFVDNVSLYFKLIGEERSDEVIALMSSAVKAIREESDIQDSLEKKIVKNDVEFETLSNKCELVQSRLKDAVDNQQKKDREIATLRVELAGLEELRAQVHAVEEEIVIHRKSCQEYAERIKSLTAELTTAMSKSQLLEEQTSKEAEKRQTVEDTQRLLETKPQKPVDISSFVDYLGYNLTNLGVPSNSEYYHLLKEHLSKICFDGIPIIVNRLTGMNMAKCVANTLTGSPVAKTLVYRKDISNDETCNFLASAGRVVCLDNFIGNCNETELLPVFDRHKDKIIFLAVAYDGTMRYVSSELLRYCHYLNLNRITALSGNVELTEEPSTLEEIEYALLGISSDNRYASLMKEILCEVGYSQGLIAQKSAGIVDEQDLCRVLAFDILPYSVDVLQVIPYNVSARLVRYAGEAGRCPYGNLLRGWFT